MTPRVPTAEEQIAFLANIQTLLDEGQFTASYKFALLIALADLAIESAVDDGQELEIPIEKIAEKFVAYYWRQAVPWSPAGRAMDAVVLRQNAGKQAEVLTRVFDVRERVSAYEVEVRRNSREWRSLISKVKHVVAGMPLWKLQTLRGRKLEFLYENTGQGAGIVLKRGVAFNLRHFHPLVTGLARSAWAQFVRQLGANHDALGQAVDLEEFLFGTPRADLSDYRPILEELQSDRCFYCNGRLRGRGAVDHFVPWRRYPVDLAHNFVLSDAGCNSRKSDLLADVPFLERWVRRNDDAKHELAARFTDRHLPFDFVTSTFQVLASVGRPRQLHVELAAFESGDVRDHQLALRRTQKTGATSRGTLGRCYASNPSEPWCAPSGSWASRPRFSTRPSAAESSGCRLR